MSLSAASLAELDDAVQSLLRSGQAGALEIIGAGEMTCVLAWQGHACKRLPPVADAGRLEAYTRLLNEYIAALRATGCAVTETDVQQVSREGMHIGYVIQPRLPSESMATARMRAVATADAVTLLRPILDVVDACTAASIGIDANLSNWAIENGRPVYFDVSTPMLRDALGHHRLDTEMFVATLPVGIRGMVRRFLVNDLLDRYFDRRCVYENLLGDLPNSGLEGCTEAFLAEANRRLTVPLTLKRIRSYRREDWWTWRTIRLCLRAEAAWRRLVVRTPAPHLVPTTFKGRRA
jgi:hypothetical protein